MDGVLYMDFETTTVENILRNYLETLECKKGVSPINMYIRPRVIVDQYPALQLLTHHYRLLLVHNITDYLRRSNCRLVTFDDTEYYKVSQDLLIKLREV